MEVSSVISKYKEPPILSGVDEYSLWKQQIRLWRHLTDLPRSEQAIAVALSLENETRNILNILNIDDLASETGLDYLLGKLEDFFGCESARCVFSAVDKLETTFRDKSSLTEYIGNFEQSYAEALSSGMSFSDTYKAYRFLKNANLDPQEMTSVLSACGTLTYSNAKSAISMLFRSSALDGTHTTPENRPSKVEHSTPENVAEPVLAKSTLKALSTRKVFPGEPLKPRSAVQIFIGRHVNAMADHKLDADDRKALVEKFKTLKDSRRCKFITQAVEDDMRYQEEAAVFKAAFPDYEALPKFSMIFKKDLEWWLGQKQIILKTPSSAYTLFVQEKTRELMDENETSTTTDRMKQISAMWNALSADEKNEYASRANELVQANKETLENSSDAVKAVENYIRQSNASHKRTAGHALTNGHAKQDAKSYRTNSPSL